MAPEQQTVEWIDTADALAALVREVAAASVYGVDTEFHRERTYWPQLALVQVCWEDGLALIDPLAVDLAPLAEVLGGPGLAVFHAADQDLEVLDRACGCLPSRLFDTQLAAGFLGYSTPSLSTLVLRFLGRQLAKGDRLTDWMRRPLTDGQRAYAAADVAHLLELHALLEAKLVACGRLVWAEQESLALRDRTRVPQDPDASWWRIKDSRSLRGESRGVAQAVAAWRERRAASLDRPPRMVLSDMAILGIANHLPTSAAALRDLRGVDGRHLKGGATAEILGAVRAGLDLPTTSIRLPVVDTLDRRLRPAVTLVSAWVSQLAADLRIDPSLLATRADLGALLRGDLGVRLATGWRANLVGEPVRRLIEGDAALAFRSGSGDLVLEARSNNPFVVEVPVPEEPAVVEIEPVDASALIADEE